MPKLTNLIKAYCPGPVTRVHALLQTKLWPNRFLRRRAGVLRKLGRPDQIIQGPFAGMKFLPYTADKCYLPKIVGSYEAELHESIEKVCQWGADCIVVAGAGEGYYAVGLARRNPEAKVWAFDCFRWAQYLLQKMIQKNQVERRVTVGGYCSPKELAACLAGAQRPVVICDVEGYELELLDPARTPDLAKTLIVVELHDELGTPIKPAILQRFSATHEIEEHHLRDRELADFPSGYEVPDDEALWAIDERKFRGIEQTWLYMQPRNMTAAKAA